MPKQTNIADTLALGLVSLGWVENLSPRSSYREFSKVGVLGKLFIGRNGALRKGTCSSKSFSIAFTNHSIYAKVLNAGKVILTPSQFPESTV